MSNMMGANAQAHKECPARKKIIYIYIIWWVISQHESIWKTLLKFLDIDAASTSRAASPHNLTLAIASTQTKWNSFNQWHGAWHTAATATFFILHLLSCLSSPWTFPSVRLGRSFVEYKCWSNRIYIAQSNSSSWWVRRFNKIFIQNVSTMQINCV